MDFRPNVRKLAAALLCGFLLPLLVLTYWQVVAAARLQASPYNERPKARREAVHRGSIFDRNEHVLAETEEFGERADERVYPLDEAAAHVVGYSAKLHGQDGIERTQEDALVAGGLYRILPKRIASPRGIGCDLTLTLDAEVQRAVYAEMGSRRGAVVAIQPRTGEVLCMVSAPSFRPGLVDREWDRLSARSDAPLLNRATARRYQLDAPMQLVVAAAALDAGVVQPTETFRCTGAAQVGGVRITCGPRGGHGRVRLSAALELECRATFAELAGRIGVESLDDYLARFGLRDAPDIELPAHSSSVPNLEAGGADDFLAACFDREMVQLTPLAMCMAVAGVANEGRRMRPHLVATVSDVNGRVLRSTKPRQLWPACTQATAADLAEALADALRRGSAQRAGIPDVRVAGVAGSAPQADGSWAPWFIGFAPADAPELAVSVVIEDGGRSGAQAATLARRAFATVLR